METKGGEEESGRLGSVPRSLAPFLTLDVTWQKAVGLTVKVSSDM